MLKITSVALSLFFVTLSPLSHSDLFCTNGPCNIKLSYENGGELTTNQAIITFGEGASIELGESGSYDLGLYLRQRYYQSWYSNRYSCRN